MQVFVHTAPKGLVKKGEIRNEKSHFNVNGVLFKHGLGRSVGC
jgi:hypothetical protein